jgi:galactan 5-O-arabinofuranosyltransferase
MVKDQNIRLFPHTTFEIQYTLTALAVLGCVLAAERLGLLTRAVALLSRERQGSLPGLPGLPALPALDPLRLAGVGVMAALLLAGGMAGSATNDEYMPTPPSQHTGGSLAWAAQQIRKPDGQCPRYADHGFCTTPPADPVLIKVVTTGPLVCRNIWDQ